MYFELIGEIENIETVAIGVEEYEILCGCEDNLVLHAGVNSKAPPGFDFKMAEFAMLRFIGMRLMASAERK